MSADSEEEKRATAEIISISDAKKKSGSVLEYFTPARIAFEKELRENHPIVMAKIVLASKEAFSQDIGIVIGVVAAEFNIIMDGMYSPDQIEHLYDLLYHKLVDKRKVILQ